MLTLTKGENAIIRRNLLDAEGNPLLLSSLQSITLRLRTIKSAVFLEYTYPSTNLRQGTTTSQLEFELIVSVSSGLPAGYITLEIELQKTDSDFQTDLYQTDILQETAVVVQNA